MMQVKYQIGGGFWSPGMVAIESQAQAAFSVADLFKNGELGFWLDSTQKAHRDTSGAIKAVVGDTISIHQSALQQLIEPDLISQAQHNDLSAWQANTLPTSIFTLEDGVLRLGGWGDGNLRIRAYTTIYTEIGKWYELSVDALLATNSIEIGGAMSGTPFFINDIQGVGNKKVIFLAARDSYVLRLGTTVNTGSARAEYKINYLKQLSGVAAIQATASKRPMLTVDGVYFDSIANELNVSFTASLANCTIILATKNNGIAIQENQLIPQNYVFSQNYHQLLLINRTLTTKEIAGVTSLFNQKMVGL